MELVRCFLKKFDRLGWFCKIGPGFVLSSYVFVLFRAHLVREMTIPLGEGIAIPENRRMWNGIAIPIP
jgi:hypothetical protein